MYIFNFLCSEQGITRALRVFIYSFEQNIVSMLNVEIKWILREY